MNEIKNFVPERMREKGLSLPNQSVNQAFNQIGSALCNLLQDSTNPWFPKTKSSLFKQYQQNIGIIETQRVRMNNFFRAAQTASGMQEAFVMPEITLSAPDTYQLASRPLPQLQQDLQQIAGNHALKLATGMRTACLELLQNFRIGLMNQAPEDPTVVRFIYPYLKLTRNRYDSGEFIQHVETTDIQAHYHLLVGAKLTPLKKNRLNIPIRVQPVFDAIPDFLHPFMVVLSGDKIDEKVASRRVSERSWTESRPIFKGDPALCFFNYVWAAWDDSEAEADFGRTKRERTEKARRLRATRHSEDRQQRETAIRTNYGSDWELFLRQKDWIRSHRRRYVRRCRVRGCTDSRCIRTLGEVQTILRKEWFGFLLPEFLFIETYPTSSV